MQRKRCLCDWLLNSWFIYLKVLFTIVKLFFTIVKVPLTNVKQPFTSMWNVNVTIDLPRTPPTLKLNFVRHGIAMAYRAWGQGQLLGSILPKLMNAEARLITKTNTKVQKGFRLCPWPKIKPLPFLAALQHFEKMCWSPFYWQLKMFHSDSALPTPKPLLSAKVQICKFGR